jgi:hypothetical protein
MRFRTTHAIAAVIAFVVSMQLCDEAAAQSVRARFSFDGIADCQSPPATNFPIHGEATGALSTNRSASLNFSSNVEGQVQINTKLGARPTEAPGGTASLHVAGRHTLRAVRDYPNNSIVIDMTVIGNACTMKVTNVLKRGKTQYTFYTGGGRFAYCSKPQITKTECSSF